VLPFTNVVTESHLFRDSKRIDCVLRVDGMIAYAGGNSTGNRTPLVRRDGMELENRVSEETFRPARGICLNPTTSRPRDRLRTAARAKK